MYLEQILRRKRIQRKLRKNGWREEIMR